MARWATTRLRRLVHLSGYQVGRVVEPRFPPDPAESATLYARLGAYEVYEGRG